MPAFYTGSSLSDRDRPMLTCIVLRVLSQPADHGLIASWWTTRTFARLRFEADLWHWGCVCVTLHLMGHPVGRNAAGMHGYVDPSVPGEHEGTRSEERYAGACGA